MSDHIRLTIADLQKKVEEYERNANELKRTINQLASMAGMDAIYADADLHASSSAGLSIRADQFYGFPLATCVSQVLELRKARNRGPATVAEIYDALVEGGFHFETQNPENAKRNLRISISKNTATFHKLPNGRIGLKDWYPAIRTRGAKTTDANAAGPDEDIEEGEPSGAADPSEFEDLIGGDDNGGQP